jgi:histidinol phosphatase-like enzyme (inositol monophosphatase family)
MAGQGRNAISPAQLTEFLDVGVSIAEEAGGIAASYFRAGVSVELKDDRSPVTRADRESEELIRARLSNFYPEHGILGEEFGETRPESAFRWVVDPIDGTLSFVSGIPLFTTLLALLFNGEPVLGVIHNPMLSETVSAATDCGCRLNGEPCHVSDRRDLGEARLLVTDFADFYQRRPEQAGAIYERAPFARTWADGYGYALVASGRAEVMIDPIVHTWDVAPMLPILTEAGGRLTSLDGEESGLPGTVLATNGFLHEQCLSSARKE